MFLFFYESNRELKCNPSELAILFNAKRNKSKKRRHHSNNTSQSKGFDKVFRYVLLTLFEVKNLI